MSVGVDYFLSTVFLVAAWTLTLYSLNFFVLLFYLSRRKRAKGNEVSISQLPMVTIQLPLYNEKYVSSRLIDAVCNMDYPKDRLEIQVLDDSEDDSREALLASIQKKKAQRFQHPSYIETRQVWVQGWCLENGNAIREGRIYCNIRR